MYLCKLLELLESRTLLEMVKDRSIWDSMIVNKRKPHTYRVFTHLESGERICLHKFDPCNTYESFIHPHPWPGAFIILEGGYSMELYLSTDRESPPTYVCKTLLHAPSSYEITNPLTWHGVTPLVTTYTVMINGPAFPADEAHVDVRTTKGKDLDKMPEHELIQHLTIFKDLVK